MAMIVQPDFPDHWKTQLLEDRLDDKAAGMYVIRFWAYCQNRKKDRFKRQSASKLKAICKAPHDPELFESAMVDAGFIEFDGDEIVAHQWAEQNAALINSWLNGSKGGRPRGKTQKKPTGFDRETDEKPIREEGIREDGKLDLCSEASEKPSELDDPVFISIPLNGRVDKHDVTESQIAQFETWYPIVDVRGELKRIVAWNTTNPKQRKTINGIARHINSWLSKVQDKGGTPYYKAADSGDARSSPNGGLIEPEGDWRGYLRRTYDRDYDGKWSTLDETTKRECVAALEAEKEEEELDQ